MGRVILPRPRMLRGLRQSSITVEGTIVTSAMWNADIMTYALLTYLPRTIGSGGGFYVMREGGGPLQYGMNPVNVTGDNVGYRWERGRSSVPTNIGDEPGTSLRGAFGRFVWLFFFDYGDGGSVPTTAYCIPGERPVYKTTGFSTQTAGSGSATGMGNPYTYGSRDNQGSYWEVPFYATGMWPYILTDEHLRRLALSWDVPLDPVVFILNDRDDGVGIDLSGNGHHVTFNDLELNRVDNTNPALRIPAR